MANAMKWQLAQINLARLSAPLESPALADFVAQLDQVNAVAEASPGFVWRLKDENNNATALRFFGDDMIVNLSIWDDVDTLKTFAYQTREHVAVLRRRSEWFLPMKQAHLAMWWIPHGTIPSLADAQRRLEAKTAKGATPYAFDFTQQFTAEQAQAPQWKVNTLLHWADNALILAQRVSEWCGHGPVLEEDIAMANVGLDLLGQARMLYSYAGVIEGCSRDEDQLAYFRDEGAFRNWSMCELPNALSGDAKHDDYAITLVRNCLFSAQALLRWTALANSSDAQVQAIANKAIKESQAHWRHASQWVIRLGDGTQESQQRMQAALERLWPYSNEWFTDAPDDALAAEHGFAPLPSSLRPAWLEMLQPVFKEATLTLPKDSAFVSTGKRGLHTEYFGFLLAEMQSVARAFPGATW
jgi:ring-1,2-phenylacetyl-CoA epoxidase subunit PaaC